jgi:alkylation response protein AidB-like acyl-CoA dehydrogenase
MDFRPSRNAAAFRAEVGRFLDEHWTREGARRVAETGTHHDWDLHRAFAARGFMRAAIPEALGGEGRSPEELAALFHEFEIRSAPYDGMATATMVAFVLAQLGSSFHREQVVARILRGEALACLGYTEPESGSDVAAARTRATRQPDGSWQIDGQKIFTSLAEVSDWVFLLTRTNPDVAKHAGLSFFLVPLDTPGIEIQEIRMLSGKRTNATFYDRVRIDDRWRVGEVDGGWDVMRVALAYERGVVGGLSDGIALYEAALQAARTQRRADGSRLIDDRSVRERLVRTAIDNEVAQLLGARSAWVAAQGGLPGLEGSQAKLFATEAFGRASERLIDLLGPAGLLARGETGAPVDGFVAHCWLYAPVTTLHGGTSEIQRNNIAERLLGLPRAR